MCWRSISAGVALAVLLAYCRDRGIAGRQHVFARSWPVSGGPQERRIFADALDSIGKMSFAFFVPVYFAIVGLKLDLIRGVSLWMIAAFLAEAHHQGSFRFGWRAGLRDSRLDLINLAINQRMRAWPGHCAGQRGLRRRNHQLEVLIRRWVVAAVLTSQIAGACWSMCCARAGVLKPVATSEAVEVAPESPSSLIVL